MKARNHIAGVLLGIAALAPGVVTSCGSSTDSAVIVHVQGPTTLPAIVRLHAILSNNETSDEKLFPPNPPGASLPQAIAMPTAFSITLPRMRTGEIDIALNGLDVSGTILANGTGSTTIVVGGTAEVTITLAAGFSLCGDGHLDDGEECDDGDRVTNGTCDFRCQIRTPIRGKDAGASDGSAGGSLGMGGAGTGGRGGTGAGGSGTGGSGTGGKGGMGAGGSGAGGTGTGGKGGTGAGGSGTGGSGAGGSGSGGSGLGGAGAGGGGGCNVELLTNGTFDTGPVAWTFTSPVNSQMIYMAGDPALGGIPPASPSYAAVLGRNLMNSGTTGVQETMAQPITVPSVASTIVVQGFFQIQSPSTVCLTCNSAVIEIVHNPDTVNVKTWTAADGKGSWMAFGTTIDATPFRGTTVLFQLRASATSTAAVPFYFDSLSAKVDRCGP